MTRVKIEMIGKKFNMLLVLKELGRCKNSRMLYLCKCDCGNKVKVYGVALRTSGTKSCGCLRKGNGTHLMRYTSEYNIWRHMKGRCLNPKNKRYPLYGGRGISVCDKWLKFEGFYEDMKDRPSPDHSIDRIDNSKGYSLANCRWANQSQQCRNKRNNRIVSYKGETLCLTDAIERYTELDQSTVRSRLDKGWSIEDALEQPLRYNLPESKKS